MTSLAEKVTVVTGAGSGIGKAIALALVAQGATVVVVGRRIAALESTVASADNLAAGRARAYPADLCDEAAIQGLSEKIIRDFRRVDILVHSAAIATLGDVADSGAEDFDLLFRTNLLAPHVLTRSLLPVLRDCQGQIVFINSSAGLAARGNVGQYAATKHGLKAIADALRDEVNCNGVRVLSVFPGRTATPTQERLHALEGRSYSPERLLQPEDVASVVVHALGLPRTAEVTEIKIRPMVKSS